MENDYIRQFSQIMHRMHRSDLTLRLNTGFSRSEFGLMNFIACHQKKEQSEGVTISEISEFIQISKPAISQIVNALEEKELVQRLTTKKDRRVVYVSLTEKGQSELSHMKSMINGRILSVLEKMGEEDASQFIQLLDKFSQIMSEV